MDTMTKVQIGIGVILLVGFGWWGVRRLGTAGSQAPSAATSAAAGTQGMRAEVHVGDAKGGELGMKVENVRTGQKLAETAPWFEPGGNWVVFDCVVGEGSARGRFMVGIDTGNEVGKQFSFGRARLVAKDRAEGARLLAALCAGFGVPVPKEKSPMALVPLDAKLVVLGEKVARSPEGGFGGDAGDWTATKLFIGDETEVFFNYNSKSGAAEFSEKDSDYREGLVQAMAETMRDGPRPMRTSATDPRMSELGPKIEGLQTLEIQKGTHWQFSGTSLLLFVPQGRGTAVVAAALANPAARETWTTMEGSVDAVTELASGELMVEERLVKEAGTMSSEDVERLWRVDRGSGRKSEIVGDWGERGYLGGWKSISPGGEILAIKGMRKADGEGKKLESVIYFVDSKNGKTLSSVIAPKEGFAEIAAWRGTGVQLRAVMKVDFYGAGRHSVETYEADPRTGEQKRAAEIEELSPQGGHRMTLVEKEKFVVKDVASGTEREFLFHEDDQRYAEAGAVFWVSEDYLAIGTRGLAFINVKSMKMSMLGTDRELKTGFEFSRDFKWAVAAKDGAVLLGKVVVP